MLQDAELEAVTLQSEIRDLEQDKIQLCETLLEKQRELLAWEKKLQMAQETKRDTEQERGKEGDVGAMRAEIHRMQVLDAFHHTVLKNDSTSYSPVSQQYGDFAMSCNTRQLKLNFWQGAGMQRFFTSPAYLNWLLVHPAFYPLAPAAVSLVVTKSLLSNAEGF